VKRSRKHCPLLSLPRIQIFATTATRYPTTKKRKELLLGRSLRLRSREAAAGRPLSFSQTGPFFQSWEERTLQVGGALLWRALMKFSGEGECAEVGVSSPWRPVRRRPTMFSGNDCPAEKLLSIGRCCRDLDELGTTSVALIDFLLQNFCLGY